MPKGLVIGTFLPFHKGHENLIEFGRVFMNTQKGKLNVLINTRDCEPIPSVDRTNAIDDRFGHDINLYTYHGDVPQNPSESETEEAFWKYWRKLIINTTTYTHTYDYVFASEDYGHKLAEILGAKFIPFDMKRNGYHTSGTEIRNDPIKNYEHIADTMKDWFRFKITVFGAESTGKSTLSQKLTEYYRSTPCHEWARPYLEICGTEVTMEKMLHITYGQYALQQTVWNDKKQFVIQDTDLLSTIGYYRIYGQDTSNFDVTKLFKKTKSDLYLVMNSHIPFEEDPIRYGGDKRESSDQFWIDLLNEFDCNYYVMRQTDPEKQYYEALCAIDRLTEKKFRPLKEFVRT